MKISRVLLTAVVTGLAASSAAAQGPLPGWRMLWKEDFNSSIVRPDRWQAENVAWPYNGELEYYLPSQATSAFGLLKITAERRAFGGRNYVSARINTQGRYAQQFGRFEASIWVPAGQGIWPAFWLLPASGVWPPEIDIMETIGSRPNTVYLTNHFGPTAAPANNGTTYTGSTNYTAGFHKYAVEWSGPKIDWYVDDVLRFTSTVGVPQEPMYMILNLAVGGNLPGNPNASTPFPSAMYVDWVRAYQRDAALINPGFETAGQGAPLATWLTFGNASRTTTAPASGTAALRVTGITAPGSTYYSGAFQDLPASPGQLWRASGVARQASTERLSGNAFAVLKIEWLNAAGGMLSAIEAPQVNQASPVNAYFPVSIEAAAPLGTAWARVAIVHVQPPGGSGAAQFDDINFGYAFPVGLCLADFNEDGIATVQDIFDFLAAWFSGDSRGDFNGTSGVSVQDIFDFLGYWFQGCA